MGGSAPDSGDSPKTDSRRTLTPEVNARVLKVRKNDLLGKTVVGVLSPRGKNGHFIKWNHREPDRIFISAAAIEECFGDSWQLGMKVRCTIVGLGPDWAQSDRQHPFTQKVEKVEESKPGRFLPWNKWTAKGSAFFSLASGKRTPLGGVSRKGSFGTGWQQKGGLSRKPSHMSRAATASPRTPRNLSALRDLSSLSPSPRCQSMSPRSPVNRSRTNTATRPGRGGKPKSNFVFSHSNRSVLSTADNPMAIGRSDAVRSWRK